MTTILYYRTANSSTIAPIKDRRCSKETNPPTSTENSGKSYEIQQEDSDYDKQNQVVIPKLKPLPEQVPHLPTYVDTVAKARGVRQETSEDSGWEGDYYGLEDYGI